MLTRIAKLTFSLLPLLCIMHTANVAKNVLSQDGFLDGTSAGDSSTATRWLTTVDANFPSSTTILPAHDEMSRCVSRLSSVEISSQTMIFVVCVIGALVAATVGFSRLMVYLEQRYCGWPERF
jgi:hypothetical protein